MIKLKYLYDTLYFMAAYYNEDKYIQKLTHCAENPNEEIGYYFELKKNIRNLPDCIRALCYSTDLEKNFLLNKIYPRYQNTETSEMINAIRQDQSLKEEIITFIFPGISIFDYTVLTSGSDDFFVLNKIYKKLFQEYEIPETLRLSYLYLSMSFHQIVNEFTYALVKIESNIIKIHEKYQEKTDRFIEQFYQSGNWKHNLNLQKLPPDFKKITEVSLLNPFLMQYDGHHKIMLGMQCQETIGEYVYKNISIENFCRLMNSELPISILTLLTECDKICAEDIQNRTGYGITYIYKYLALFTKEKIIYHSDKNKKTKYYSLNTKYFYHLMNNLNDILERKKEGR